MSSSDSNNETTDQSRDDSSDAGGPSSPKRRKISGVHDQASTSTQTKTSEKYDQAGLTKMFHGVMYQLAHYMLIIERASELEYTFKLAKEMTVAEKFDDLVFECKRSDAEDPIHRFVQFKHEAPETKGLQRITANDLLNVADGDYSLLKYFKSFRKIRKRGEFADSDSKVYILCTNRGMEDEKVLERAGVNVQPAEEKDEFMGIVSDQKEKGSRCYRLKAEPQDNPKLYELFKSPLERRRLAQELAEHVCQNKKLTLSIPIFREHHRSLTSEVIVINTKKKTMRFNDDFIDPDKCDKLTEEAKKFRDIFWSHVEKSTKYKDYENQDKFFEKLKDDEYQITENFGEGDPTELPDVASDEDIKNFLENFIIAVWQPNEQRITEIISEKMEEKFKLLDVKFLMGYFHKGILDWFKEAGKEGRYFTERETDVMFEGILDRISTLVSVGLSLCYTEMLNDCKINFRSADVELKKFLQPDSKIQEPLELCSSTETLLMALRVYHTIKSVTRHEMKDSYIFIELDQLKRERILNYVSRAWKWPKDQRLLVVDCGADGDRESAQKLLNSLIVSAKEQSKKLILISHKTGDSTMSVEATSFKNLDSESQKRILQNRVIKFQGSDELTSLSELLAIDEPHNLEEKELDEISEMINSDGLVQLICAERKNNSVSVGSEAIDNEWNTTRDYYIPRTLIRYETINFSIFRDSEIEDRLAISGIEKTELQMLVDHELGHKDRVKTAPTDPENSIFLTDQQLEHQFKDLCAKNRDQNIHWLHYDARKLVWKKTHGDIKNVNVHRSRSDPTPLPEKELQNLHDEGCETVIIVDVAGMGKSTILSRFVEKIREKRDSSAFLVKINLRQCLKALDRLHGSRATVSEEFFIEDLSGLSENFEKRVLKRMIERKNNVIVMFDGLDEIELKYQDLVIDLLKVLRVKRIFVTARPERIENLELCLNTYSYQLKPFVRKDQIDFLCRFWSRKIVAGGGDATPQEFKEHANDVIDLLERSVDNRMQEIFGVPLQTRLVAEVYEPGTEIGTETIDVAELFSRFIDKKLSILVDEKSDYDGGPRRHIENLKNQLLFRHFREVHQELAMRELFGINPLPDLWFREQLDEDPATYAEAGIFTLIKGEVQFNHQTYAEYFAAAYVFRVIPEMSKRSDVELRDIFERKLFVGTEYSVVRAFLNCILQKSQPRSIPSATESWKLDLDKHRTPERQNAYQIAVKEQTAGILKLILSRLAEENNGINAEDYIGRTPLHVAASRPNNLEVVKVLVEGGANVNSGDEDKRTPLHLAASRPNNLEVVKFLVEGGANVNSGDKNKRTPLHLAASRPNNLEVVKFLVEGGANVNSGDKNKRTPLHLAAFRPNNLEVVKFLVEGGANVNSGDEDKRTPLHLAASRPNNLEVVKFLVEGGANVNSGDEDKRTPLHLAASRPNKLEVVKFLVEGGANVNSGDEDKRTPLHLAASRPNNLEVVKFLVEGGANVNSGDKNKRTPLHLAASRPNNLEVVKFLVEGGANVNSGDKNKRTPLHLAACQPNNLKVVEFLVEHKADVNSRDIYERSPLDRAARVTDNHEVEEFLVANGAQVNPSCPNS